jgi:hypothetical protein
VHTTSEIQMPGVACTISVKPSILVQSSSENDNMRAEVDVGNGRLWVEDMKMEIPRFLPIDDDEPEFNSREFAAGYDARFKGEPLAQCATRSWRAGWADADMAMISEVV